MTYLGTDPLHGLDGRTQRSDPHVARGPVTGRLRQPPRLRRRRGPGWVLLALSVGMLITGLALPQGLLLASGLVTAGVATHLLAPPRDPDRPALPLPAPVRPGSDHQCPPGRYT